MDYQNIKTFGELKAAGYFSKSIKAELRDNLVKALKNKEKIFTDIIGYDDSVIPELENAILSGHNIILLGLRGQAKTRIARSMVKLLDEYIPVVKGSEINDDPFKPVSRYAIDLIKEQSDNTEIEWLHRDDRYAEKLATPDVTVADLIGDVDPIKAANLKLAYSDERVLHFGIIPRSHRSLFVINELPDLQARIQVALFNMLQEKDVQIRGFKVRLPLDIQFMFTANPEDYTNRGSIVTPLKDRIESQILTHYPKDVNAAKSITAQEAKINGDVKSSVVVNDILTDLIEEIAFEARKSEYIDSNSGVSARLSISALELLYSSVERRMLKNNEMRGYARISDLNSIIPAVTGKVELVYEGEQEGPFKVASILTGKAIKKVFLNYFPDPEKIKNNEGSNPYKEIVSWFNNGNYADILFDDAFEDYESKLNSIPGLSVLLGNMPVKPENKDETLLFMELALHGLSEHSLISKSGIERGNRFDDILSSMFSNESEDYNDDDDLYYDQ